MRILIQSIAHKDQRYPTVGDWWTDIQGDLHIRVSELPDQKHMQLIAIHELIEALLCKATHVDQIEVDRFDQTFAGDGEPGDDPKAPYYQQHQVASGIEQLLATLMNVRWLAYGRAVESL